MTIHHTRMFRKLIILLCVCASVQAALNYVHNDMPQESAQPLPQSSQKTQAVNQSLATQIELSESISPAPQQQTTAQASQRIKAPSSAFGNDEDDETIEFYFEDADLQNLLNQIASLYQVVFITDDMVTAADGKAIEGKKLIKGNKISFKTNKPLTKKAAWDLFLTFLEIAGFTLTTKSKPNIYSVVPLAAPGTAIKVPLPSYIGTKPDILPTNDQMIRYVYFVQNTNLDAIFPIIDSLRSTVSSLVKLTDLDAFLLTDKAYNIVNLMEIVTELDKVTMPQAMSVLKLKRADADDVKKLYEELTGAKKDEGVTSRLFPARKQPTALYFPEGLRMISYKRTNALILLGPEDAIKKIEEFVTSYVDVEITAPYPPIRVHNLRYANAEAIAKIMNEMTAFDEKSEAAKSGGVRGEDKYIKKMTFTAEPASNRLIVEGDEEDYLMAKEILDKLDEQQPQVAIEVLLLSITVDDSKQLGAQLRSKVTGGTDGLLGDTVKFQTSGLYGTTGIATSPTAQGANILLGNLINLAVGAPTGNTLLSLGTDQNGVWGLLQALQSVTNAQIVATPFLVATNKTKATVTIGQTRRVVVANVIATATQSSQDDKAANLQVEVTPQINSDGMIVLDLKIRVDQFANTTNFTDATVNTKQLDTKTILSDGEVLALGGLIQNNVASNMSEVPILGKIPILGWLFKNRQDLVSKNNLLVLICPRILPPDSSTASDKFTNDRILSYHTTLADMFTPVAKKDPVDKFFFETQNGSVEKTMEDYIFKRHDKSPPKEKPKIKQLEKNQRARKRSSRTRFTSDKDDLPTQTTERYPSTAYEAHPIEEPVAPAPAEPNASQAQAPAAPARSDAQKRRRALSTFMDDMVNEGTPS